MRSPSKDDMVTTTSHSPARRRDAIRSAVRSAVPYALVSLPLSAMVFYAKWRELDSGGFAAVARLLKRSLTSLSVLERLSLLRGDMLALFLVVPATVVVVAALVRPRWRPVILSTVLAIVALAFYGQVRAYAATGAYLHVDMVRSALGFGIDRPDILGQYVTLGGFAKTLGVIALTIILAVVIGRASKEGASSQQALSVISWVAGVAAGVLIVLASLQRLPRSPGQGSMLFEALRAYVSTGDAVDKRFEKLDDAKLVAAYRSLAGIPISPIDRAYFGRTRGYNLVRIVLETVPASCLDVTGSLDRFPALRRLRERAFVSASHYTTSPNSSLSNYAALSGWYPPPVARPHISRHLNDRLPSILWPLRNQGYKTALYAPFDARFEMDRDMYRLFGIERHVFGGVTRVGAGPGWADIARADSVALRAMLADIAAWSGAGAPFVAMFMPQISHAPWTDPVPSRRTPILLERCRSLVEIEDRWIGDILRALEQHSQLDRTVVLVTGDHGIRTAIEDPAFATTGLSEYTFRVPLLLFAPNLLTRTKRIDAVNSTIDLAPTLHDLFGVERSREHEQGNALWDPRLPSRTTFLLAGSYSGADGFYHDGRFFSWNAVSDVVCVSPGVLTCESRQVLGVAEPLADSARTLIRNLKSVQSAWTDRFIERTATSSERRSR